MLTRDQGFDPLDLKGSYAGAMGYGQFMPSSFLEYAVDGNSDGRRDIWHTEKDVFASAANYLAQHGWRLRRRFCCGCGRFGHLELLRTKKPERKERSGFTVIHLGGLII